jgi:redox-sensitive bicupin YhaK (pirin superfamily)
MLGGIVEHGDSIGNSGRIGPGDIQWMTAGRGVVHQEMPKPTEGMMHGLQLWVNLPAKSKMMEPRYRGITEAEVPLVKTPGTEVKVIAGKYEGVSGPVKDLIVDVEYLDVRLAQGGGFTHHAKKGYTSFCYIIEGSGEFDGAKAEQAQLVLFGGAGSIAVKAAEGLRYIFVSGERLLEPVAWGGPIVMNTQEELDEAFRELDEGTFIKK